MGDRVPQDRVDRYYESFDEWARLDTPSGRLEHLRALELLDGLVPVGAGSAPTRVLDLGGGPGRYAIALARRGHAVTLADPSRRQLEVARERAVAAHVPIDIVHADARDLSRWEDGAFDAVVAFGPFYHLIDATDRATAAREIARVLRPEGLLLAQLIPRLSGLRGLVERAASAPSQVAADGLQRVLRDGVFVNTSDRGFPEGWYPTADEVGALFVAAGFAEVGMESLRGVAAGLEEAVLGLQARDPERFEDALRAVRATARDPAVVALGGHAVWVGRRR